MYEPCDHPTIELLDEATGLQRCAICGTRCTNAEPCVCCDRLTLSRVSKHAMCEGCFASLSRKEPWWLKPLRWLAQHASPPP